MKKVKIGIVGSESSHTLAIAKLINIDHVVEGCSVDYLWGETDDLAKQVAKEGRIAQIVQEPAQMIGHVDAVVVDHRHGKYHISAARPFAEEGIPIFIDKPLCYEVEEGREFIEFCQAQKVPIASFSVLPLQHSFRVFLTTLRSLDNVFAASLQGVCDVHGPHGGIFFYGVHLVEMAIAAFGCDIEEVTLCEQRPNAVGQLFYSNGLIVTLNLINDRYYNGFGVHVTGNNTSFSSRFDLDGNLYLSGVRRMTTMFFTGVMPQSYESLLYPVRVLAAMNASLRRGGAPQPL